MRPVRITKALATADDDNIAASQTPSGAGNLTLNGVAAAGSPAIATLDTPRRVLVTTASNESSKTLTIYGTVGPNGTGNPIVETMTGPNVTTGQTTNDFGTVTRVAVSAAFTGAVKVGTSGVGSIPWQMVDYHLDPTEITIAVDVTGTVNYTVQYTYDDIMGAYSPTSGSWIDASVTKIFDDAILASVTTDGETTFDNPITAWRVTINSSTAPGSLAITGIQAGVGGIAS